jgi:hypothetical protein
MYVCTSREEYNERRKAQIEKCEIQTELKIIENEFEPKYTIEIWIYSELQIIFSESIQADHVTYEGDPEKNIYAYFKGDCIGIFRNRNYDVIRFPPGMKI